MIFLNFFRKLSMALNIRRSREFLDDTTFSSLKRLFDPDNCYKSISPSTKHLYLSPKKRIYYIQTPKLNFHTETLGSKTIFYLKWRVNTKNNVSPGNSHYRFDVLPLLIQKQLVYMYWYLRSLCFPGYIKMPKEIVRTILNQIVQTQKSSLTIYEIAQFFGCDKSIVGFNRICEWLNTLKFKDGDTIISPFTLSIDDYGYHCSLRVDAARRLDVYENENSRVINPSFNNYSKATAIIRPKNIWNLDNKSGVRVEVMQFLLS